jgi:hypothetical protein
VNRCSIRKQRFSSPSLKDFSVTSPWMVTSRGASRPRCQAASYHRTARWIISLLHPMVPPRPGKMVSFTLCRSAPPRPRPPPSASYSCTWSSQPDPWHWI